MLGAVALNHVIVHRRTERRYAVEAARLCAGLAAELRVLGELYETNLDLLEEKAGYLLSTRSPVVVYRSNLGRLTSLLDASIIQQLVTIFARNEQIEALLAAHATSKAGLTFQLTAESKVDALKDLYRQTARELEWTRNALEGRGDPALAAHASVQWAAGLLLSPQPSQQQGG
jgi:hypothetical protein